ncbi:MAG: hypothetical protein JST46_16185 [Bacteroidetes bacterium]|nr:hypothetical protein [Bacteroidota bacterium]
MSKLFQLTFLLVFSLTLHAQSYRQLYAEAEKSYKEKDYPRFYEKIKEANALHPWHQDILYRLGAACALTGRNDEALTALRKAILVNARYDLTSNQDLASLRTLPGWKPLLDLQKEWNKPVTQSREAFRIKDRQLHAEGIAQDGNNNQFYLGSIHKRKIVKVNGNGMVTDFCPDGIEGLSSVFGVQVDLKRNLLWACSSPMREMEQFDSTARSALYKFDLATGRLLEHFPVPEDYKEVIFGDLLLDPEGVPLVSDSRNNIIWRLNQTQKSLEPFFTSKDFWNIQGLAYSTDGRFLFVADYIKGVFRLDLNSKDLLLLPCQPEVSMKGIDGLYVYKNTLIAIQNGVSPQRVTQYYLNDDAGAITRFEIIDRAHPDFGEPTLGVLRGNEFYYIANSQWEGYTESGAIKDAAELKDIIVLKAKLN